MVDSIASIATVGGIAAVLSLAMTIAVIWTTASHRPPRAFPLILIFLNGGLILAVPFILILSVKQTSIGDLVLWLVAAPAIIVAITMGILAILTGGFSSLNLYPNADNPIESSPQGTFADGELVGQDGTDA